MEERPLYGQLGGAEAIGTVVDEFYERVLADERVAHHFAETDMVAQRAHQTQFLSAVTGGPVEYDGEDMQTAHEGMGITTTEFDAIASHLDDTLETCGVGQAEREQVLEAVESYRDDIVEVTQ